jgi:DNA-binding NtrC family response regulator
MPRMLVVDDEEDVLKLLSRFFTKKNYQVITADTAEDALRLLKGEEVDVVLLDIYLPGLSGVDALGKIQEARPDLPVVMISGQEDEELAKKTLRAGAFDYVVKPLDFDYLERTIHLKLLQRFS